MLIVMFLVEYGQCGVGAYCLGGCDPRMSFSIDSCVPAPVCKDRTLKMDNLDGMSDTTKYLGDPSKADWAVQGKPVENNGEVLLTMEPKTVGTVLASTVYMWYGNVKARMKTGTGRGVVTAFILFSDVKDEIDYEWVGADLAVAQTNYYFQGIPDCKALPTAIMACRLPSSSLLSLTSTRHPLEKHYGT